MDAREYQNKMNECEEFDTGRIVSWGKAGRHFLTSFAPGHTGRLWNVLLSDNPGYDPEEHQHKALDVLVSEFSMDIKTAQKLRHEEVVKTAFMKIAKKAYDCGLNNLNDFNRLLREYKCFDNATINLDFRFESSRPKYKTNHKDECPF